MDMEGEKIIRLKVININKTFIFPYLYEIIAKYINRVMVTYEIKKIAFR